MGKIYPQATNRVQQKTAVQRNEEPSRRSVSETRLLAILLVIVCAAVFAVHWSALSAQATSFDDEQYLFKNPLVQNPSWKSAWRFLSEVLSPSTVGGYYQPLTMISLMLDFGFGGRADNLMPFHLTSLCLHTVNTALVIVFLYVLFGDLWPAIIVGLLFGVHPLTVEPIPWISERKTLLASFFAL
jgi:protein O-mannosyl-transferase